MKASLLAIDVGTTGAKVGAFDVDGNLLAGTYHSYPLSSPKPGWSEQNPEDWWDAVLRGIDAVTTRMDPGTLQAVCVVGQNPTLVCVDAQGSPLRSAITWGDRRAVQQAEWLSRRLGQDINASFNLPKLMWLRDEEVETFRATATVFQSFDFLNYRLTGQKCSVAPLPPWPAWQPQDLEAADLCPDVLPETPCLIGEKIGTISAGAQKLCGLPKGLPVIAGLVDGLAACLGTGTVEPGELYFGSGTTSGVNLCWSKPVTSNGAPFGSIPHPLGRLWLLGGPTSTGAKFFDWFADSVCRTNVRVLSEEIAREDPDSSSLLALPYLMGERAPIYDPAARAVFFGLSEKHTRLEMGKAAMESVAFAIRDVVETLYSGGLTVSVARTGGGGSRSNYWNQLKSDILGKTLLVPQVLDSSLLGAAIVAAWGAGLYPDAVSAVRSMVHPGKTFEPQMDRHRRYSDLFQLYRDLYRHLKEDFSRLSALAMSA